VEQVLVVGIINDFSVSGSGLVVTYGSGFGFGSGVLKRDI
jgi:hypothetical protein